MAEKVYYAPIIMIFDSPISIPCNRTVSSSASRDQYRADYVVGMYGLTPCPFASNAHIPSRICIVPTVEQMIVHWAREYA